MPGVFKVAAGLSVLVIVASVVAFVGAIHDTSGHSVDLRPLGPILMAVVLLPAIWIVAVLIWALETHSRGNQVATDGNRRVGKISDETFED